MNRLLKVIGGAWLVCTLGVFAPTPVLAQLKLTVNSTGDAPVFPSRTGVCETSPGNGVCTLRAAIQTSNAFAGADSISVRIPTTDPNYDAQTASHRIPLGSALPNLTDAVTISGPGASKLTIRPKFINSQFRVFNVTAAGTVTLSALTIANGRAPAAQGGGGVQLASNGTLNINNCVLANNEAGDDADGGGAILNAAAGTVNIRDSTLKFNVAVGGLGRQQSGGGLYTLGGIVNIVGSTFYDNTSDNSGGGLTNIEGVVTVQRSTFRGNASHHGGGIHNERGILNVVNSTFYENIVIALDLGGIGFGGGISNSHGTLNLTNSTLTANFAGDNGSGLFNHLGTANVKSSIIAENRGGTRRFDGRVAPDVDGSFVSHGFNLIGKRNGSSGFTAATDKTGTIASPLNPRFALAGLRNNGGPTETIGLQSGSPAIDKGTSLGLTGILSTDQRGGTFLRKVDKATANTTGGDGTDIGAYEVQ